MPTPNDDRSRSKNEKDSVGQNAKANHEKQVRERDAEETSKSSDAASAPKDDDHANG